MNRIISLLCPTRGCPDRVCVMLESIIKTTEKLENVEILFYIESDDDKKDDYIASINNLLNKYNNPFKRVLPHIGEPMSVSKSCNIIAEKCQGDILVMANDNEVWINKGWDRRLNKEADNFPDDIYCIYFDDGIFHGKRCRYPMLSRKWYETLGYFMPEASKYGCNSIEYIARYMNRLCYISDILVEDMVLNLNKSDFNKAYEKHIEDYENKLQEDAKKLISKMEFNNISNYIMLFDRINSLEKTINSNNIVKNIIDRTTIIYNRQNKIIDSLAWFIPFRKKRDEFRSRFNDNFIWRGIKNIGLTMRIGIMLYLKIGASFPKVLM